MMENISISRNTKRKLGETNETIYEEMEASITMVVIFYVNKFRHCCPVINWYGR